MIEDGGPVSKPLSLLDRNRYIEEKYKLRDICELTKAIHFKK